MRIAHASEHLDLAEPGFVHAVALAAHSGESEVVTLHVTQGRAASSERAQAAQWLGRWATAGARVTHTFHECPGHDEVPDELIAACESLRPELLVMSTHARMGLARVFAGSIAEAVARNVAVPSLLLPLDSAGFVDLQSGALTLRRVLVAGGSQQDAQLGIDAAAWLLRAVAAPNVELSLLHTDDGTPAPAVASPAGFAVERALVRGPLEHAVSGSRNERPDLLVMVTHGHDQLRDVLMSSHTERVLHQAKLPLLWVPSSFVAPRSAR